MVKMFSILSLLMLLLNFILFTCPLMWLRKNNTKQLILISNQIKPLFCSIQSYVQTINSFKIMFWLEALSCYTWRISSVKSFIQNKIFFLACSDICFERTKNLWPWKSLSIVQMNFFLCILFCDLFGNALTTENNFLITFFLLHPGFLGLLLGKEL